MPRASPTGRRVNTRDYSRLSRNSRSGQTLIEYVLVVALLTLVFGTVFYKLRLGLFNLWVCEIAPRVQAPTGCGKDTKKCWNEIQRSEPLTGEIGTKCKI